MSAAASTRAIGSESPTPTGVAARRRNRKRQRILEEATRLFEQYGGEEGGGHDKTTVEEIAECADIGVRTFFRYFESKTDAIYLDLPTAMRDNLAETAKWLQREAPLTACLRATEQNFALRFADPFNRQRALRALSSTFFKGRRGAVSVQWEAELAKLVAPYLPEKDQDLYAGMIAKITTLVREFALQQWVNSNGKENTKECFDTAIRLLRDSFTGELASGLDFNTRG